MEREEDVTSRTLSWLEGQARKHFKRPLPQYVGTLPNGNLVTTDHARGQKLIPVRVEPRKQDLEVRFAVWGVIGAGKDPE